MTATILEWQAMSPEEREIECAGWSVHDNDGLAIVYSVASKLVRESSISILDITVGRGNFDVWFIDAWVLESDLDRVVQPGRVDGFEVSYRVGHDRSGGKLGVTFDEWVSLSEHEREELLLTWNSDAREGFDIVLRVAAKLVEDSDTSIIDVNCLLVRGTWYIHALVSRGSDLGRLPSNCFGVRVFWSEWWD